MIDGLIIRPATTHDVKVIRELIDLYSLQKQLLQGHAPARGIAATYLQPPQYAQLSLLMFRHIFVRIEPLFFLSPSATTVASYN